MKLVKTASGKTTVKMSRKEWANIGKKAGWIDREAAIKSVDQPNQATDSNVLAVLRRIRYDWMNYYSKMEIPQPFGEEQMPLAFNSFKGYAEEQLEQSLPNYGEGFGTGQVIYKYWNNELKPEFKSRINMVT